MIDLNQAMDVNARILSGNFFVSQNDLKTSLALFQSALELEPFNMSALCNTAYILMKDRQLLAAESYIKTALTFSPDHPHALGIYALIAQESPNEGRFESARMLFEHSLRGDPANSTTLLNYAYMLQVVGDFPRALEIYTQARDRNVLDLSARFQRSMCMMTLAETPEQWREALREYEIRHLLLSTRAPNNGSAVFTGEDVEFGKSLLIVCEQGVGDSVMMGRYVRKMKPLFKNVYLFCQESWVGLLDRIVGVDGVFSDIAAVPPHDYYIQSMSLLLAEHYPVWKPSPAPYLQRSSPSLWDGSTSGRVRIGVCWQGNPAHGNDRWRSVGPDLFCDAFADVDADFYSLHTPEVNRFCPDFIEQLDIQTLPRLADFIQAMDMVITVDTAILHIAGALGVPTYALIPTNCDWRWGWKGDSTDWYPSVTLFRASEPLGWKSVLGSVRNRVDVFVDEHRSAAA